MDLESQTQESRSVPEMPIREMPNENGVIAIFSTHSQAERAVRKMQQSGFDMKKLSIVGKNYETDEAVLGYYNMGERASAWGKQGAFWGGLWGLIVGSAILFVPGVGPVTVAGTFVSALLGGLEGAVLVGGLSAFGAALFSLGVPKNTIVKYEEALKAGEFLVIAHGTNLDLIQARDMAQKSGALSSAAFQGVQSPSSIHPQNH